MASGVNVSGTYKDIDAASVNISSVWKTVAKIHANVSGTWEEVWPNITIAASLTTRTVSSTAVDPSSANCYYKIGSDGDVYGGSTTTNFLEVWRDTGSNPDFEVRATYVSGVVPTGTFNSWLDPATAPEWVLGRSGVGTNQTVMDVEIRNSSTLAVLTTARITMNATVNSAPP
jgi:hypothetical protein